MRASFNNLLHLFTPRCTVLLKKRFSASQEIPRILWNQKFHYHIHKSPPTVPILSQLELVRALTSHFLKIHLNTFAASYLNTQGLNNSCLKSPASTLVDLTFQSRALRSFSLNQLHNLSL